MTTLTKPAIGKTNMRPFERTKDKGEMKHHADCDIYEPVRVLSPADFKTV
jgi:hypothetical protein